MGKNLWTDGKGNETTAQVCWKQNTLFKAEVHSQTREQANSEVAAPPCCGVRGFIY